MKKKSQRGVRDDQSLMNLDSPQESAVARAFVADSYQRYGAELRRYLQRRLRNQQDARDLAQEVWRRLLRIRDATEVVEPLAYIYRAAANVIAEYQLLRSRDCVAVDSDAMQYAADHPADVVRDEMADQLVRQAELQRILASVPKTYREVLLLRVTEGLSYEEIGRRLQFSPKTVEQYFFRAMTLVRKRKQEWQKTGTLP
jgi:RNA polymerase sigma factor (sigma-70 family)